jgi:hypothetical protein
MSFIGFSTAEPPKPQKPCARRREAGRKLIAPSASGDPAIAFVSLVFILRMTSVLRFYGHLARAVRPPYCGLTKHPGHPACITLCNTEPECENARRSCARRTLFNGGCCAARGEPCSAPLELLGQVGDTLREDRDLYFRRTSVAGFLCIRLDDFRFAFCGYRHRQTLSLRPWLAVSPVRLKTRLGMSSPLPISARANKRPPTVT